MSDGRITIDQIGFRLFDKWLRLNREGKSVVRFFENNRYRRIAIYGVGLIGIQLYEELSGSDVNVVYAIDIRAAEKELYGIEIICPSKMSDLNTAIDAIVVTPVQSFYEIEKMLLKHSIGTDIISIEQVIEYAGKYGY